MNISGIKSVTALKWGDAAHTWVDTITVFQLSLAQAATATSPAVPETLTDPYPFGAHANDPIPYGSQLFSDCVAGKWGPIADYIAPPPIVPFEITDRQFFQAAALAGMITQDEAIAMMATGALPAALGSAMISLPANQQFAAKMKIIGARVFQRADPFLTALGAAMSKTPAQIDQLFQLGITL